jgi:hypothetical protein
MAPLNLDNVEFLRQPDVVTVGWIVRGEESECDFNQVREK